MADPTPGRTRHPLRGDPRNPSDHDGTLTDCLYPACRQAAENLVPVSTPDTAATEEPPKLIDVPEDSMEREPPCPGSEHGGSDFVVDPWCPECARTAPLDWTCAPCAALYAAQSGGGQ